MREGKQATARGMAAGRAWAKSEGTPEAFQRLECLSQQMHVAPSNLKAEIVMAIFGPDEMATDADRFWSCYPDRYSGDLNLPVEYLFGFVRGTVEAFKSGQPS